jgi:hypothetical protein
MAVISTLLPTLESIPLYAVLALGVFVIINILNQWVFVNDIDKNRMEKLRNLIVWSKESQRTPCSVFMDPIYG